MVRQIGNPLDVHLRSGRTGGRHDVEIECVNRKASEMDRLQIMCWLLHSQENTVRSKVFIGEVLLCNVFGL